MKAGIGETCYAVSALRKVCFHKDLQSARVCTRDGHEPIKEKNLIFNPKVMILKIFIIKNKVWLTHLGKYSYAEYAHITAYMRI